MPSESLVNPWCHVKIVIQPSLFLAIVPPPKKPSASDAWCACSSRHAGLLLLFKVLAGVPRLRCICGLSGCYDQLRARAVLPSLASRPLCRSSLTIQPQARAARSVAASPQMQAAKPQHPLQQPQIRKQKAPEHAQGQIQAL